jgi:hypothetical protein
VHDLVTSDSADVVVHADELDAGDLTNHRLHERPSRFDEMVAYLFEKIGPLLGRQRLDQVLFGGSQYAMEADKDNVVDQVGANALRPRYNA